MNERILGLEEVFKLMRYPAGESHLEMTKNVPNGSVIQCSHIRNFDDLSQIVVAAEILKHRAVQGVVWFIPYFPFGREDRRRTSAHGFELDVAMKMVEHLQVITLDPHSDVLGRMPYIPQAEVVRIVDEKLMLLAQPEQDHQIIVIPDAGATKKAYEWAKGRQTVQGHKVRNTDTGALSGFALSVPALDGEACLIVDDICDGGGTFLGLAKALKKAGAGPLTLFVTHGLFTKGTETLLKTFDRIITTGPGNPADGVERFPAHKILEGAMFV